MAEETRLRLCDFCDHEPIEAMMKWPRGSPGIVWTVKCTHCGASGPFHKNVDKAIEMWQQRRWAFETSWDHEAGKKS